MVRSEEKSEVKMNSSVKDPRQRIAERGNEWNEGKWVKVIGKIITLIIWNNGNSSRDSVMFLRDIGCYSPQRCRWASERHTQHDCR